MVKWAAGRKPPDAPARQHSAPEILNAHLHPRASFQPHNKPSQTSWKALADARAEAGRIAAEAKAEMQAEVDAAMKKADAEIAARTAESEARIAEIRDGAAAAVKEVAKDTAEAVVAALGIDVDRGALDAAVDERTKG